MNADYARAIRDHEIALLCEGQGIVGLIETIDKEDHLWIENVAVAANRHGQGFGRRLLTYAEDIARQRCYREVRLLTNADFKSNLVLYERFGYSVTRREPFMAGVTVYMKKSLREDG